MCHESCNTVKNNLVSITTIVEYTQWWKMAIGTKLQISCTWYNNHKLKAYKLNRVDFAIKKLNIKTNYPQIRIPWVMNIKVLSEVVKLIYLDPLAKQIEPFCIVVTYFLYLHWVVLVYIRRLYCLTISSPCPKQTDKLRVQY